MEANVRAFLISEIARIGQEQESVRRKGEQRSAELLDAWAGRVGTAAARSVKVAQEHSRVSPVTPLPRAMATDRVLRGTTITGQEDEEKRRTLPTASGKAQKRPPAEPSKAGTPVIGRGASTSARAGALARGYQPAVVKVVSYAHGAARASATANYVDREDAVLETHEGNELKGRDAINAEIAAWAKDFEQRAESQDVSSVRLHVAGLKDNDADRAILDKAVAAAFAGHSHAYRIDALQSGAIEARAVVAFAGSFEPAAAGEPRRTERFSVTERQIGADDEGFRERVFAPKSEARMKARIEQATGLGQHRLSIEPGVPGHGQSSVIHRLTQLTERGAAISSTGDALKNASAIATEARAWRRDLRSFSPRDTMHMIVSAKSGTDVEAFTNSVRGFLHEQFADHKFMFGVHTDKADAGHIHAHAIVTVRNGDAQKISPGPQDFRAWREVFAEHAQANSLKIVATSAAERASSQSYGPKDKAIVEAADRPRPGREARDRAYAAEPANRPLIDNARRRIETAKTNPVRIPKTARALAVVNDARQSWYDLVKSDALNLVAVQNLARTMLAQVGAGIGFKVTSSQKMEPTMPSTATSEQLSGSLRQIDKTVDTVYQSIDPSAREAFNDLSTKFLNTLAVRADVTRLVQSGQTEVSPQALQQLAGDRTAAILAKASDLAKTQTVEAQGAERLAETVRAGERRDEAQTRLDPASVKDMTEERRAAAITERSAAQTDREATAAREAARQIAANPARTIPQNLVNNDPTLEQLRIEQERVLKEVEAEAQTERQTHRQKMR
jgi:type IV secretory pathway VirD2 relaxase